MKLSINKINRNTIINWLIFGVSMLVCLFLLEMVMRQIYPSYDPRGNIIFQNQGDGLILGPVNFSGRQWRNSGDFNVKININKDGFRDDKDLKDSSSEDIFVIGDSYSFGHGVEEEKRFSNMLEDIFFEESIQIYNTGISVSHILNYRKRLEYTKTKGGKIKNLIVGLCMENDILDYDLIVKNENAQNSNHSFSIKNWLNQKSTLYNFIATSLQSNRQIRDILIKIGWVADQVENFQVVKLSDSELESSILQIKELIKGYNSLIVLIPFRLNWIAPYQEIVFENHETFKELLKKEGINILDLKPVFERVSTDPLQYFHFKNDGHWNSSGHQLAAEEIFKKWQKLKSSEFSINSEDSISILK